MAARRSGRKKQRESGPDEPALVDSAIEPTDDAGRGADGAPPSRMESDVPFGLINWALSVAGVVLLICGFLLLARANAQGDNLPALISPFVIVGSYLMIFVAIILRAPSDGERSARGRDGGAS